MNIVGLVTTLICFSFNDTVGRGLSGRNALFHCALFCIFKSRGTLFVTLSLGILRLVICMFVESLATQDCFLMWEMSFL